MSGRIFIISTVYASDTEHEKKNNQRIIRWRWEENTEKEFEKFGYEKTNIIPPFIASRDDKFELVSAEGNILPYSKMVAKGCALRNKLISINKKYAPYSESDIVLYFDGDGQIKFEQLFLITKHLSQADYVTSCRGEKFGIDDERKKIEFFENFLISHKTGVELPDAQCGCWGFKAKYIPDLLKHLSAEGFEIELDLILFFLRNGIIPKYVQIDVEHPKIETTYKTREEDRTKLIFLMEKLGLDGKQIQELCNQFTKKYSIRLPEEYTNNFGHSDIINFKSNDDSPPLEFTEIKDKNIRCCLGEGNKNHLPTWHPCR